MLDFAHDYQPIYSLELKQSRSHDTMDVIRGVIQPKLIVITALARSISSLNL
jgi:hypothetical protein